MNKIFINTMAKLCNNCSDFIKYDIPELEDNEENLPFFWMTYDYGGEIAYTHLNFIDINGWTKEIERNSSFRFGLMRDKISWLISSTSYGIKNYRHYSLFYYDGVNLNKVENPHLVNDVMQPIVMYLRHLIMEKFPDEYAWYKKPITIKFATPEAFKLVLQIAHTNEWQSLREQLIGFRHWQRWSTDHVVWIGTDRFINDKSFGFAERINGEQRVNGGIVYWKPEDGETVGRWSKHT